jgi:hypothetical protein
LSAATNTTCFSYCSNTRLAKETSTAYSGCAKCALYTACITTKSATGYA